MMRKSVNDVWVSTVREEIELVLREPDLSEEHRVGLFVGLVQHEILKVLNLFSLGIISALIVNGCPVLNALKNPQAVLSVHDVITLLKGSLFACGLFPQMLRVFCLDCDEFDSDNPEECTRCDVVKRMREVMASAHEIEALCEEGVDILNKRNNPH